MVSAQSLLPREAAGFSLRRSPTLSASLDYCLLEISSLKFLQPISQTSQLTHLSYAAVLLLHKNSPRACEALHILFANKDHGGMLNE